MRQRTGLAVIGMGMVMLGCGSGSGKQQPAPPPPAVRTEKVQPQPVEIAITVVGTLEPAARVVVAAQEEGIVTAVLVREGDRVRAGDLVVQLDDRRIRAELAETEARLLDARAQARRAEALERDGLLSASEADTARASLAMAEARADVLRTRLGFTRITAPVDGVVTARRVEVGNLAAARNALLELAAGPGLVLRVPVSELDVVHLRPGDTASVRVDALPDLVLSASITRVFPAAEGSTRQVTVELGLPQPPPEVKPGFLARARLVLERRPEAVLVPEPVLQRGSEAADFVWVLEGDVARVRPVEPAERLEGKVVIRKGLAAGDELVVEGLARLRDGGPVRRVGEGGRP
ncbi:MAG TPA: efflux RND transporter periplasmic adaptor subunit [Thermoanaerobaculaceae bacterium]|nr:efflux RND transporter periplasmic adaptor subunit [Thermoanaerobaculaceae bacterium]HRS16864.1 efflux RND transporter periplasmic adaptor subunit [Thermoanaerobaculaceae bacterium]